MRRRAVLTVFLCLLPLLHQRAHAATRERPDTLRGGVERQVNLSLEMDRAGRLITDKRYGEAIPILERVCAAYPRVDAAAELLAGCYLRAGRPQEAVTLLEERLVTSPRQFSFMRDLGHAYLDLGRKEDAVRAWERILSDEERYAAYYGSVARLEQDAGLYEEALRTYRRGRRFEKHFPRYTIEIVRLERLLGRYESAFREGLAYLDTVQEPGIEHARFLTEIFHEGGDRSSFIAAVDSAAAASAAHRRFFRLLETLMLVEAGRYGEARILLARADSPVLDANEFYSFLNALAGMDREADADFRAFLDGSLDEFIERHGASPIAPGVLLIAARYRYDLACGQGPPDSARVREVIALADSAAAHPFGAAYAEKAVLVKATVLLEGLRSPELALLALDRVQWRGRHRRADVEELRVRALLASGDWRRAKAEMEMLVTVPDSTLAVLGRFGLGRLAFFERNYGKAVELLSGLAEKHPASTWANDALETAMLTKAALEEGTGPLDLYRAAVFAGMRSGYGAAIDSLAALEERYPASVLGPRALFLRAEFEEEAGRRDDAEAAFSRLAERYPLHELAPRALERIALLLEEARPAEAARRFEQIMERYPGDPFLERVRMRYMALRKSAAGGQ